MKTQILLLLGAVLTMCSLSSCDVYASPYGIGGGFYPRPAYYGGYSRGYAPSYGYGGGYAGRGYGGGYGHHCR